MEVSIYPGNAEGPAPAGLTGYSLGGEAFTVVTRAGSVSPKVQVWEVRPGVHFLAVELGSPIIGGQSWKPVTGCGPTPLTLPIP